jgi:protein O-mannosyl-transferase
MSRKTGKRFEEKAKARSRNALRPAFSRRELWVAAGLALLVALVFAGVGSHAFINLDDDLYIYDNPAVAAGLTPQGIAWAFTTYTYNYWTPVTWLVHMLNAELFGLNAGPHHLVSALLHALNAALLFFLLLRMTGAFWRSALVAALFAVHPLRVESVAWAAELKDVLAGFFWLLAAWAYLLYTKKTESRKRYALVVGLFALALMSKPSAVTFPFALLLLDYWPLGRREAGLKRLVTEKIPMFAMSAACAVVTLIGQHGIGATEAVPASFLSRVANAIVAYAAYLRDAAWPQKLAVLYPFREGLPALEVAGCAALLALITAAVLLKARQAPYAVTGWLWFLGVLAPSIGIIQVGYQARADRFTYLPLIGIFVAVVWGAAELVARRPQLTRLAAGGALVVVAALAVRAWIQVSYWRNPVSLFERTLELEPDNKIIHNDLGMVLLDLGRSADAAPHFVRAIQLEPKYHQAYNNLGKALYQQRLIPEALNAFSAAVRLRPDYAIAQYNRGVALKNLGQANEAYQAYRMALANGLAPRWAALAHGDCGVILSNRGSLAEAAAEFYAALRIDPSLLDMHKNLAIVSAKLGHKQEARSQLSAVLAANPGDTQAQAMLRELEH